MGTVEGCQSHQGGQTAPPEQQAGEVSEPPGSWHPPRQIEEGKPAVVGDVAVGPSHGDAGGGNLRSEVD